MIYLTTFVRPSLTRVSTIGVMIYRGLIIIHMNICHFYFAAEISPFFLHFPDFHRMIIPIARLTSSLVSAI